MSVRCKLKTSLLWSNVSEARSYCQGSVASVANPRPARSFAPESASATREVLLGCGPKGSSLPLLFALVWVLCSSLNSGADTWQPAWAWALSAKEATGRSHEKEPRRSLMSIECSCHLQWRLYVSRFCVLPGDPQLHPGIRTACYEEVGELLQTDPPDLIAFLMPNFMRTDVEDPQQGYVPDHVLDYVPHEVLVVFSSRFELQEKVLRGLGSDLVLPQIRCPFSAGAGDPHVQYDDNGWIFATKAAAMAGVLRHAPSPSPLRENRKEKVKTLFWGIVDLKYDAFKPVLDRLQVLETGEVGGLVAQCRCRQQCWRLVCLSESSRNATADLQATDCSCAGDGRISKFSGHDWLMQGGLQQHAVLQVMGLRSRRRSRRSTAWRRKTSNYRSWTQHNFDLSVCRQVKYALLPTKDVQLHLQRQEAHVPRTKEASCA